MLSLKYLSLLVLVFQNSLVIIAMRLSRVQQGPKYFPTTAVFFSECIKFILSFLLHYASTPKITGVSKSLSSQLFGGDSWRLIIPAGLYSLQNNLMYMAISVLDAASFQVTYQLKILTTAFFAVILLHQRLTGTQWLSLLGLTGGVALVQVSSLEETAAGKQSTWSRSSGLLFVILACILSGISGVYFEKILKHKTKSNNKNVSSVWLRNVQLSLYSIPLIYILGCKVIDGDGIARLGFLYGYTAWTWAAICLQATGGLLVAATIRYADNILKGFATSLSILVSATLSSYFLGWSGGNVGFWTGAALVITSTWLYGILDAASIKKKA